MKKALFLPVTLATVLAPLVALLMLGVTFSETGDALRKAGRWLADLADGLADRWRKLWGLE